MKRLMVMAGGTGGHVFPGLAVAKQLQSEGWEIRWLGTADRMEAELVPQHGFEIDFIDISGVRGNGLKRLLAAPFRIIKSIIQANKAMADFKPDVVLGMGGFASGPGGVAARLRGLPLVLHEQNAAPGATNRLLSRMASRVLQAFPGTFDGATTVGNPVRDEVVALADQVRSYDKPTLNLLVIGGSLGARILNQTLPQALAGLEVGQLAVRHQVGKGNTESVQAAYKDAGVTLDVEVSDFIQDMAQAYQWADLIVCRAGALTVSEVAAAGLPAVFVPLPHAVDDHQTKNAQFLTGQGGGKLLPQKELNSESLRELLQDWLRQPEQLKQMSQSSRQQAVLDATDQVSGVIKQLATD